MKIYVVVESVEYEIYDRFVGAFDSKEKAQAKADELIEEDNFGDYTAKVIETVVG
jgi:hypothetical protein